MTRSGQKRGSGAVPEKRCLATGEIRARDSLIRFVLDPTGQVVPDLRERLPGRGLWVSANRSALELAARKNLFSRAAKAPAKVPDGLVEMTEAALARRTIELLSLARKAGLAVAGFEKVKSWLASGEARLLIQASDGSHRGKMKLHAPGGTETHVSCLTSAEIGLAFGREHVIHAALRAGRLATHVANEAARLSGVRDGGGGSSAGKESIDV